MSNKMSTKTRKVATALVIGATLFAAVYGLAASLGVTSNSLGAGNTAVAACQTTGNITTTYTTAWDTTNLRYKVGEVTASGVDATCNGLAYKITLTGSGGTSLGEASGTAATGSFATTTLAALNVNAASVTGVNLVIAG